MTAKNKPKKQQKLLIIILEFVICPLILIGFIFMYLNPPKPQLPDSFHAGQISDNPILPVILTFRSLPLSEQEKEFIKAVNPLGFILFEKHINPNINLPELKQELAQLLGRQCLFFVDQEGGSVNRLKTIYPGGDYPSAQYFEKEAQTNLKTAKKKVYEYGLRVGKQLKELAIDVNFAPNAEVAPLDGPGNMPKRCYSSNPHIVKELSYSYAKGLKDAGVEPCYKHAIGVAAAPIDPHFGLPIIRKTFEEMRASDLIPFEKANEFEYLMVAHALYPKIDNHEVSTYSQLFYTFVRNEIKFDGFIITDALNMKAASSGVHMGDRALMAFEAGADIVMPLFDDKDSFAFQIEQLNKIPKRHIDYFNKKLQTRINKNTKKKSK